MTAPVVGARVALALAFASALFARPFGDGEALANPRRAARSNRARLRGMQAGEHIDGRGTYTHVTTRVVSHGDVRIVRDTHVAFGVTVGGRVQKLQRQARGWRFLAELAHGTFASPESEARRTLLGDAGWRQAGMRPRSIESAGVTVDTSEVPSHLTFTTDTTSGHAAARNSVVVWVERAALDAMWRRDQNYVGPTRGDGNHYRRGNFVRWLGANPSSEVAMPTVGIVEPGRVTVEDGRHRLSVLRDLGVPFFPVLVHRDQARELAAAAGAADPGTGWMVAVPLQPVD